MAVTMTSAGCSGAQTILADVPPGSALLDAPMSAACGVLGALDALGVTGCPMLHLGERMIFLVRPELDFEVDVATTSVGEARPITFWPSAQVALGASCGWQGDEPVWIIPPEHTGDGLPDVATLLDAIATATVNPAQVAADALMWRLASEQFRRHAADAGACSACAIAARCACVELASNGLHVALGHPSAEADYWRGLTRIRRSQPNSAGFPPTKVLVGQ